MVIKSNEKSYFDDAGAIAPAEILSFWANFVYGTWKILLCSIEQKTQKNIAQLRKILSKKAKLSKKNGGPASSSRQITNGEHNSHYFRKI